MPNVIKGCTTARLHELLKLQKELSLQYGEADYNVFIFGSYPTMNYKEGESDIDIAIYSPDFKKYLKISCYLEQYFKDKGVDSDIFYIDTTSVSPFYCAPLNAKIQFTEYYPEELVTFENLCRRELMRNRMEMDHGKCI